MQLVGLSWRIWERLGSDLAEPSCGITTGVAVSFNFGRVLLGCCVSRRRLTIGVNKIGVSPWGYSNMISVSTGPTIEGLSKGLSHRCQPYLDPRSKREHRIRGVRLLLAVLLLYHTSGSPNLQRGNGPHLDGRPMTSGN